MGRQRVALVSLGCAKNQVDAEYMLGNLRRAGFSVGCEPAGADIVIVNTCAFIAAAQQEAIDEILVLAEQKKRGRLKKLIISGCLPRRYAGELPQLLPEVDGFFTPADLAAAPRLLRRVLSGERVVSRGGGHYLAGEFQPRHRLTPAHSAYVKIADGCDNRCRYCLIPQIRGGFSSRRIESVLAETRRLAEQGVREINLISQDTTSYGKDWSGKSALPELLTKLSAVPGIEWIRILYAHPRHFTAALIDCIAHEPKICRYVDLPVQHCNDRILQLMGRKTVKRQLFALIERLRRKISGVVIRTSLIVGFPQETEARFEELCAFVREAAFERLGVFEYSREPGTPAAAYAGQIPAAVKRRRRKKIMEIQRSIVEKHNAAAVGKIVPVLIDERDEYGRFALGRTSADAPDVDPVVYISPARCRPGRIVPVRITDYYEYDLVGECV
ncbi:MAG: 30S ribosomal protein S12 methylthiotransferase RimO [Candidatus Omnitrophica bacterium]|nr:30S ribosomal protein S12 methylthiotransferase RimO [Candidatus Omnitrophota bacterium]